MALRLNKKKTSEPWSYKNYSASYSPVEELHKQQLGRSISGPCGRWWGGLLRGSERGGVERVGKILGILHQLVGISDVCQAQPEDCPHTVNKAAITLLKVPGVDPVGGSGPPEQFA